MTTQIRAVFAVNSITHHSALWASATDGKAYMIRMIEQDGNVYVEEDGRIQPPTKNTPHVSRTLAELGWVGGH